MDGNGDFTHHFLHDKKFGFSSSRCVLNVFLVVRGWTFAKNMIQKMFFIVLDDVLLFPNAFVKGDVVFSTSCRGFETTEKTKHFKHFPYILSVVVSTTLQGTNISPQKWHFEDEFPFPKVGYVNSLEGIFLYSPLFKGIFSPILTSAYFWPTWNSVHRIFVGMEGWFLFASKKKRTGLFSWLVL